MGNENKETPSAKLTKLLEFDPAKGPKMTQDVFAKALKNVHEKRSDLALEKAEKLLEEAITLREEQGKVERKFAGEMAKMEKTLGKVMGQIGAIANGGQPPSAEAPAEESAPAAEGEGA